MYLENAKQQFVRLDICHHTEIEPCTTEEINILEKQLKISFPGAYREFLLWMGHGAGRFLRGAEFFYGRLFVLLDWANEVLEENHFPGNLPQNAFVFYMHQGYEFAFFIVGEGDDPPVYYYNETIARSSFAVKHNSFSEFLLDCIERQSRLMQ